MRGIEGPTGPEGPEGRQGKQGDRGLRGERGVEGPQGIEGAQGLSGITGAIGPQGPAGCCTCQNETVTNLRSVRIIRSKGNHTIEPTDDLIMIDITESVTLYLPDISTKGVDPHNGGDFYTKASVYTVGSSMGSHYIKTSSNNSKINGFLSSVPLGQRGSGVSGCTRYEFVPLDNGNWVAL